MIIYPFEKLLNGEKKNSSMPPAKEFQINEIGDTYLRARQTILVTI
jgi:hypothetical protein